jgi:CRISPR-associated protein Csx17
MSAPSFELRLEGCSPVPLGGYLKALGVFRLVAEQADPDATGCWRDERFVLRTRHSEAELIEFFTDRYAPSPVISPWNAGSGFYYRERKSNERGADGKKKKTGVRDEPTTATRTLDALIDSRAARFEPLRQQALLTRVRLAATGLTSAPSDEGKVQLVVDARSNLSDSVAEWIDAAATLARDGLSYPPLLGSGGNDGNLDFSTTVIQALLALIDPDTGAPRHGARDQFEAAVLGRAMPYAVSGAISQFASADSGGLNAGSGFEGAATGNRWDVVLGIEGSMLMSSSAARRLGTGDGTSGAFPFTTPRGGVLSAGAGGVAIADEATARGEFWAPIWTRPTGLAELASLFREGRAVVKRRGVRNSLDFARAVAQLGVSRGLEHFDRHAFEQRNGNMYVGVALPRRNVPSEPMPDLIADLDRGRWLENIRAALRDKKGAAALQIIGRRLDDALYRLAGEASQEAIQDALMAVGAIALECGRRPRLRGSEDGRRTITPPPRLNAQWRRLADDGTAEFKLAAALAGLTGQGEGKTAALPFRVHLAPLAVGRGFDEWGVGSAAETRAVWSGRDLLRDAIAVLDRRLVEAQRTNFLDSGGDLELPLRSRQPAPLWAVTEFLAATTDDERISSLAAGLAWVAAPYGNEQQVEAPAPQSGGADVLPFLYAALKPLFDPAGVPIGVAAERRRVQPLPLLRLLLAGSVGQAAQRAQLMARGAGLPTPFMGHALIDRAAVAAPYRLAAALAFPIYEWRKLADRAYPAPSKDDKEPADAD